jgi:hypothetical protein
MTMFLRVKIVKLLMFFGPKFLIAPLRRFITDLRKEQNIFFCKKPDLYVLNKVSNEFWGAVVLWQHNTTMFIIILPLIVIIIITTTTPPHPFPYRVPTRRCCTCVVTSRRRSRSWWCTATTRRATCPGSSLSMSA